MASALAVISLTACSGEDGQQAQQLLSRAQVAQARLASAGYDLRMTFTLEGRKFALVMDGGGYMKGPRAGDQILTMRTEGVPEAAMSMGLLIRRGTMTMNLNGRSMSMQIPASARRQYDWSGAMTDLVKHVKDVRVREGQIVNGERGATVAGVVDTEGLLKAANRLAGLSQAAGPAAPQLNELAERFGDTRVALFIGTRTGLIRSAILALEVDGGDGATAQVDVTYRLKNVNRAIPGL